MSLFKHISSVASLAFGLAILTCPVMADDPTQTTAAAGSEIVASPAVTWQLPSELLVDSSGIFLNQIVRAIPPVALPQIRLAPAPLLGQTNYFSRAQVMALVLTNVSGMTATNWTGPSRVRVARRLRQMDEAELTSLLAAALQHDYVKDLGELELRFARPWAAMSVPDEALSVTLTELPAAGVNPNFMAGFDLWNGRERAGHWQAVLQAKVWREVPVAQTPLKRGELLRDVVLNISKDDNSLALTENIASGLPVPNRAVRPRPVVKRGQLVDGIFAQGSLTISLKVEIMEDGLLGQMVKVRNPKTRRELYGKVQNEETVSIAL